MSTTHLLVSLFEHKAWSNCELFATMAGLDGAVHPAEREAAVRLLNHIHVVDRIFAGHLAGEAHPYTATNTKETPVFAALHDAVRKTDRWYVGYVGKLSVAQLAEPIEFSFTDGDLARMTREEMLAHVITHGSYHRGAVGRILAQASLTAPRDLYTRYLHEQEPARRARRAAP